MAARRYRLAVTGALLAGTTALAGCSALGIERTDTSSSGSATSDAPSASPTASPTPSAVAPAFGDDATAPDDEVGSLSFGQVDRWSMTNEDDNVFAAYLSTTDSPDLAAAQQEQVAAWVEEYRTFIEGGDAPGTVTASPSASGSGTSATSASSAPSGGPTPSGTAAGPATPQLEAGTASPTTSGASPTTSPTGSVTTGPTGSATASPTASEPPVAVAPQGSGPDEMSLRVVPQLLSEGRVLGVRLYARLNDGRQVREHVRTFWADGESTVPGQALFSDAGRLRRLVLAEPGGAGAGMLSDGELFASVAFSIQGDLVLYLPVEGASDHRVVIDAGEVTPLLTDLGRAAREAAQDADLPVRPAASGTDSPSDSPEPTGESTESTVPTDN